MSWGCSTCCWVQSAPCLQRRSVRRWEPAWTAHRGCWLPAAACSSSTHTRTTDEVDALISLFTLRLPAHLPLSLSRVPVSLSHTCLKGETLSEHLQLVTVSHLLLLHLPLHLCSVLYSNTEQASVYLTRSSPVSLYQSIQYSSRTIYLCWHHLTDAVRSVS